MVSPASVPVSAAPPARGTLFGHPKGLTVLFLTGMWEVFAIFGMRTVLIYYLVKQLQFSQPSAVAIYSLSSAACVLMGLLGALTADRYLGAQRAVVLGALVMGAASFSLMSPALLYPGLALMALGNGLFKSTMVAQVGALYAPTDPRRDRAFITYKVGCNIGALLAPLICGTIGNVYGWKWAFATSGVGMLVSVVVFVGGRAHLALVRPTARVASPATPAENDATRKTVPLLALVWLGSVLFWIAYRQVESTVALWADQGVDRAVGLGSWRFVVPAAWFQSLNPCMIFLFAPLLNLLWARRETRASIAGDLRKMTLGCVQLAGAFGVMGAAAAFAGGSAGVNAGWLVGAIVLLTLGELHVDPIGQALFNRLAARGLFSVYASLWFFASLAAYFVAAWLGGVWARLQPGVFFAIMASVSLAGAGLMWLARRLRPSV